MNTYLTCLIGLSGQMSANSNPKDCCFQHGFLRLAFTLPGWCELHSESLEKLMMKDVELFLPWFESKHANTLELCSAPALITLILAHFLLFVTIATAVFVRLDAWSKPIIVKNVVVSSVHTFRLVIEYVTSYRHQAGRKENVTFHREINQSVIFGLMSSHFISTRAKPSASFPVSH